MDTSGGPTERATEHVRLVVVHGIGSQEPGSTAARWADAIFRFAEAAGYTTKISDADFVTEPAHVTVRLQPPPDAGGDNAQPMREIAIVEAHWADAFAQPTVGRVLRFLATVAPALVITQSILIWKQRLLLWPGRARPARTGYAVGHIATLVAPLALGVLALGAAAPLIAVLLLLLLLAASIPIPAVRTVVGKTLGWLSTSIGDAYLFVADPVNRAAMEQRLADLLRQTVPEHGVTTVVLAHSQGAALAYRALGELDGLDNDAKPRALITVGSGVGRLHEVGLLRKLPWQLTLLFPLIVGTAAAGLALWNLVSVPLIVLSVVLTVAAWRKCDTWLKDSKNDRPALLDHLKGNTSWLDIWASFDPVPNGRTATDDGTTGRYQLARVAGEQSIVRDHVRYDRDWDQTMPLIFRRLLAPDSEDRVSYVGVRPAGEVKPYYERRTPLATRDWTGLLLRSIPLVAAAVAIGVSDLFGVGHWIRTAAPGFLDSTVDAVFVPLRTVSDFLDATWPRAPRPQALLGFLALLALGAVGSIAARRLLTFAQRRETVGWLRSRGLDGHGKGTRWAPWKWWLAFVLVAVPAVAVSVFLFLYRGGPPWNAGQTVEAYLTAVAEEDTDALCSVTTESVTSRAPVDPCGTERQDELVVCSDARSAIAALPDEAITVRGSGTVRIDWSPETFPSCTNDQAPVLLPHRVHETEEGWRVTELCSPRETTPPDDGSGSDGSGGLGEPCEAA